MKILETLHEMIKANPKIQILRVNEAQAREYHQYLVEYHLNTPPAFEEMSSKMQYLGRKIEVYDDTSNG